MPADGVFLSQFVLICPILLYRSSNSAGRWRAVLPLLPSFDFFFLGSAGREEDGQKTAPGRRLTSRDWPSRGRFNICFNIFSTGYRDGCTDLDDVMCGYG
ncbi:hypothetical protein BO70DRAFT_52805 [Aspergillus heteromorphus CBS 117.55]|uniref:Uncharacterized protein n=1 Tax=Aspergillus heteromorphus CBS 117.55 TaxID=1448321 RepID=A0A317W3H2_9EURO|nr:uncharacterized protein BO70DRAFT_52805 [Aspergillus heteromorphus CBS 117.55]PWY79668.1 hypothetical protein BO70DRAFT_52805 [Aspergillus heteromorphus CBS 117.55]